MNKILTPKEMEVLEMVSRGCTSKQICDKLCFSYSALSTHLEHIYTKFKVRNKIEMLIVAFQSGLIEIPSKDEKF